MSLPGQKHSTGESDGVAGDSERLSLGVAARLSRYLQVLIQARKMGKETISSQELAEWTHINSTQIRRDLSGFGKFGKRGVGYRTDSLISEIRKIMRTSGQHHIALFGAGHLGQAIAGSDIFADHGFQIVAVFDNDSEVVGHRDRRCPCPRSLRARPHRLGAGGRRRGPRGAQRRRAGRCGPARRGWRADHLQLFGAAPSGAARGDSAHVEPRRRPSLRALLLPGVTG